MVECIESLANLQWMFPIGTVRDNAQELPQEVQNGLEKVNGAVCVMCHDAPWILWEYAKAMEITDDIATMYEQRGCPFHRSGEPGSHVGETIWQSKQSTQS